MTIQSERLLFRLYRDDDFDFLAGMLSDPQTVRFIGNGQTRDRVGARKFLERIYGTYEAHPGMGLMVLIRKGDRVRIGHAGLVPQLVDGVEEIEIGYWIARDFWGQGYATEAATAIRDYGRQQLARQRFISLIQPGNAASRRVAEKIGMELEKKTVFSGQDVCVYSLDRGQEAPQV